MFTPAFQHDDSQNLRDFLVLTVKQVKALHATLTALMTDVAAIRRTLLDAPDDMVEYNSNLLSAIQAAKPLVDTAMQSYNDLIAQLEISE